MAKRHGKDLTRRAEIRGRRGQLIKRHLAAAQSEATIGMEEMKRIADTTYYTVMPYYMTNAAINIERGLRHERGVSDLLEDFELAGGGPVLIVAGGPSLEVNGLLDMLQAAYEGRRFKIVAVDAVLEKLCEGGIFPDYVISADVQVETLNFYLCVEKFHVDLICAGTKVILMGNIDPKVVDVVGDLSKYFYWPVARFGRHMDAGSMWNYMAPLGIVNPHGHVTGAALSIFAAAEEPDIALIGADYAYAPGQSYEETFWYRWLKGRGRNHEEIMAELKPQTFKDPVTGEDVMTDVVWMHYITYMLNWLEALMPRLNLVNCSGRGLFYHDPLVPYEPFEEFIARTQHPKEVEDDGEDNQGGAAAPGG